MDNLLDSVLTVKLLITQSPCITVSERKSIRKCLITTRPPAFSRMLHMTH